MHSSGLQQWGKKIGGQVLWCFTPSNGGNAWVSVIAQYISLAWFTNYINSFSNLFLYTESHEKISNSMILDIKNNIFNKKINMYKNRHTFTDRSSGLPEHPQANLCLGSVQITTQVPSFLNRLQPGSLLPLAHLNELWMYFLDGTQLKIFIRK